VGQHILNLYGTVSTVYQNWVRGFRDVIIYLVCVIQASVILYNTNIDCER